MRSTWGIAAFSLALALAFAPVAACGGADDAGLASLTPPVVVAVDAGAARDASVAADAAATRDTGPVVDAETSPADASATLDATRPTDAGGAADAGREDSSASADAGAVSTDAGARTDAGPGVDGGPPFDAGSPSGNLGCGSSVSYARITHNLTTSDVVAADFAPDGASALAVARDGTVLRYRAQERDLALVGKPAGATFSSVRFLAGGDAILGGSCASGSGSSATTVPCLYRYAAAGGTLARLVPAQSVSGTGFASLARNAAGTGVLGASFASNVLSLYGYDEPSGTLAYAAGFGTTTGPTGVAWGRMNARDVALVSGGVNGSEILLYDPTAPQSTRVVRVNSSYSNLAAVAARPGAEEFFLCDWSRNFVRYDGVLTAVQSPFYSCNGVAFSSDGASALFLGRPRGTPLLGSVALYRGARGAFAAANVTDVSVPAFSGNPYQADTNAHLLAAAWRPGACEGLIVGARGNGPNAYGMVIRFTLP
jgi:hypothetical protein